MIKTFDYIKKTGEVSNRCVWVISPPSDKMLAIDLSEYSEEDKNYYIEQLTDLFYVLKEDIKQLGLESNYRYFKKDGIISREKL